MRDRRAVLIDTPFPDRIHAKSCLHFLNVIIEVKNVCKELRWRSIVPWNANEDKHVSHYALV